MANGRRNNRDHERISAAPPAPLPERTQPSAQVVTLGSAAGGRSTRNIPYEDTDYISNQQNTAVIPGGGVIAFTHPRKYANPSFSCSILNIGPGMISVRWDGQNAVFGAPDCVLIPAGMGYAEAVTSRMSIAADGTGATVSVSVENYYGR